MVGILSENREEWLILDIGFSYLNGMTLVPINIGFDASSIESCLNNSGITTLFSSSSGLNNLVSVKNLNKLKNIVLFDAITD